MDQQTTIYTQILFVPFINVNVIAAENFSTCIASEACTSYLEMGLIDNSGCGAAAESRHDAAGFVSV